MDELTIISKINRQGSGKPVSGKKNSPPGKSFKETLDRVTLQSKGPAGNKKTSEKKAMEVRHDLVNKYKLDLKQGSYAVRADEIADKIIQKIRDEKSNFNL